MTDKYVLDGRTPRPVADVVEWGRWFQTAAARRTVGLSEVETPDGRHAAVSTVFLGLDHNFVGRGPPILFETMIFAAGARRIDQWQRRYATWGEAEAGHRRAVRMVERYLRRWAP